MKYNRINEGVFNDDECDEIIELIDLNPNNDGFGIRYFLRENPNILGILLQSNSFRRIVYRYFEEPIIIKSIYFDKPPKSNWPVNWHQDITINLRNRIEDKRFKNWRILKDRVVVQPNIELLNSILTFRLHLDKADKHNGALSVIEDSEESGVIRIDNDYLNSMKSRTGVTEINRGGVMIMSPLTVHSSKRSKSNVSRRRVIHIEISEREEVENLPFIEYFKIH